MKKAILATLVSAIAVSGVANAATDNAATAEVYGQVGVSYDSHNAQNSERFDDVNVLRNTELGVRGDIANTKKVSVSYDLRTEFDLEEKAYLSRANITLGTQYGNLTVGKAESSYDNATRDFDKFDGHFTSEFELFDSVDTAEAISFSTSPVAGLDLAVDFAKPDTDEAKVGDAYSVSAKYAFKDATFAAGYENAEFDKENELTSWKLGAGYDFTSVGVAGLTTGLTFENAEFNKDETRTIGLTASYEVTTDITVIAGYASMKETLEGSDTSSKDKLARFAVDYSITDNVVASAGFAHIDKDAKSENNEYMHTVGIKYAF